MEAATAHEEIGAASDPAAALMACPREDRLAAFERLPGPIRESVLAALNEDDLLAFVHDLDPDEARSVLTDADESTRETVLDRLDSERAEKIDRLLSYDADSAGGLMNLDFVTVSSDRPIDAITERVRRFESRTGRYPTIFVVEDGDILGALPNGTLAMAAPDERAREYVEAVPSVRYDREDSDVLEVFRENRDRAVAVLDADGSVLGVIHAGDLLGVVEAASGETLFEFTGVAEAENALDGPVAKVKSRYTWLIVNLGTAFLAAAVVGLFETTIAQIAVLAAYMPVVAGMGGNAGTQAMAVTVRAISLGQVSLATGARVVRNEAVAGAINGAIIGALVAVIATAISSAQFGVLLGAVVGVSMVANLLIAGFFGALIPLVLDRVGQDPATSATIFITTATDVLGFLVFLGLAQTVLL